MKLLKRFLGRWSKAGRGLVPEGPGRNDRKGVSLIELFEKFPDNRTAVVEGLQLYVYEGATGKNGEGKTRDLSQLQRE